MIEKEEALDGEEVLGGKEAYKIAHRNLQSTWSRFPELHRNFPNVSFYYNTGFGLALPHGLIYISTESAEGIKALLGALKIGPDLELISRGFVGLDGVLPSHSIGVVLDFTEKVRAKMHGNDDRPPHVANDSE